MGDTQQTLAGIKTIVDKLDTNRVANIAYTDTAFDSNLIDGVAVFDVAAEQNIPTKDYTEYNPTVLTKGIRAQGASWPRGAFNHLLGRLSYNVNKAVQYLKNLLSALAAAMAHNSFEYDVNAEYSTGDVCYTVMTFVTTYYIRTSVSPNTIKGIPPTTTADWTALGTSMSTTGNAATATKLATARNIGGVSFDGSASINLPGVNAAGNQNTTGSSASCTGNAATATRLATARTIGGVSFNGTANINLPGVNVIGNQDTTGSATFATESAVASSCSGNAATATKLATARTIGGVSFNGTANINLPGVNATGNQSTSGNAATATLAEEAFKMRIDTAPASASGSGVKGEMAYNSATGYFYICVATNTWRRFNTASW